MGKSLVKTQSVYAGRLFRQDRLIAWNTIRATFAGWHDRALVAVVVLAALAGVHAWFADRSWTIAVPVALAADTMIGVGAGRLIAKRLAFHAFDGLLAADALHPRVRWRYRAAWHGVGLALLNLTTLTVRPSLLVACVPGYLVGMLLVGLTNGFGMPARFAGAMRPGWTIRAWSHRPIAGISAATLLLASLLPVRALGTDALIAVVGTEAMLLALMLTGVDDAIVRFMTITGHGSQRIVAHHAKGGTTFLTAAVPGCWIISGPVAAGVVAALCAAMLLLLALRVLAYQLHRKRFADVLISIFSGLLVLVAYSMPVALPIMALAMLWQLNRRGRTKTWLVT